MKFYDNHSKSELFKDLFSFLIFMFVKEQQIICQKHIFKTEELISKIEKFQHQALVHQPDFDICLNLHINQSIEQVMWKYLHVKYL